MNFKRLIRKLKYKFGRKDYVFDNGPFAKIDTKLLLDRDAAITICSYDETRGVYIVLITSVKAMEC